MGHTIFEDLTETGRNIEKLFNKRGDITMQRMLLKLKHYAIHFQVKFLLTRLFLLPVGSAYAEQ